MNDIYIILGALALGQLCYRTLPLPEQLPLRLNQFVIYFVLPSIILMNIPAMDKSQGLWLPMLTCWTIVLLSALLTWRIARLYRWNSSITGALMMLVPLGNTSYLGFPAIKLLVGDNALGYAILYDQLGNFIALAVYGSIVTGVYQHKMEVEKNQMANTEKIALDLKGILYKLFSFPPFIALLIALNIDPLPESLLDVLQLPANLMVPLTMFIVGLQFRFKIHPDYRLPVLFGLSVKMLCAPLFVFLILWGLMQYGYIAENEALLKTVSLEAAMPPMVTAGVLAMAAGLSSQLCAAMVGIGMISALLTLPLINALMNVAVH